MLRFEPCPRPRRYGAGLHPARPRKRPREASEGITLVVGCGDLARADGGLGPALAREARWWEIPGLRVLVVEEWRFELASELATADRLLLLCAEDRCGTPQWRVPGAPARSGAGWQQAGPQALLTLVEDLCGRLPEVRILAMPGRLFERGREVSSTGQRSLETARGMLRRALASPGLLEAPERKEAFPC